MRLLLLLFLVTPALAFAQVDAEAFEEPAENGVDLYLRNEELSPVTFVFKLDLNGMSATPAALTLVVPAQTNRFLAYRLRIDPDAMKYGYGYEYSTNIGDHLQTGYDTTFVYELPVGPGKTADISQGYFGKYSHRDQMALDFNMAEGTPVHAARGGIVTEVEESNDRGCPSKNCEQYENRVIILHDDGTFAGYSHLRQNGALVSVGDTVQTGQLIAESGATGFANGPHLHFSVFRQGMKNRQYVPTPFRTAKSPKPLLLEERRTYRRPSN